MMGNRGGAIHTADKRLGRARWRSRAWICCVLSFRERHREIMAPGHYTELFFLDEAVALAAGHRPCAECRRSAFGAFAAAWEAAGLGPGRAPAIDRILHAARLTRDVSGATHRADASGIPDGAMIVAAGNLALVAGPVVRPFSLAGYRTPLPRPSGTVAVLTPEPVVHVLAQGYVPVLHASARG